MLIVSYPTADDAERAIDAITAAQGATEIVRLPDGRDEERPRRRWMSAPIPLRDGTFGVTIRARLASVEGARVRVAGAEVVVPGPGDARARTISDVDRVLEAHGEKGR